MVDNNIITSLEQNFCVYEFDEHGTQITIPLKKNGFHIIVDSSNRDEYITLLYPRPHPASATTAPAASRR